VTVAVLADTTTIVYLVFAFKLYENHIKYAFFVESAAKVERITVPVIKVGVINICCVDYKPYDKYS